MYTAFGLLTFLTFHCMGRLASESESCYVRLDIACIVRCAGHESAARAPRSSGKVSGGIGRRLPIPCLLGLYTHDPRIGELGYSALPYLSEPLRMDTLVVVSKYVSESFGSTLLGVSLEDARLDAYGKVAA